MPGARMEVFFFLSFPPVCIPGTFSECVTVSCLCSVTQLL